MVKNAGFYAVLLRKTTYGQKPGCLGAENLKRKGVENLAGGSTPKPPSTRTLSVLD